MITLCLIVKNEQDNLRKCLESAINFVDEIVVVDTGSEDTTKKIAAEFTDKIYDFSWCDDFSSARNFSISKATNEWILILDADEIIVRFSFSQIAKFVQNKENAILAGRIEIANIVEDNYVKKKSFERINRLFNRNNFQYEGRIHEQLRSKIKIDFVSVNVGIQVDHIGYTKESIDKTQKLQRNINLLNLAISENHQDPYLYYQLGKAFYLEKNYDSAALNFEEALELPLNYKFEYVNDLVETYGYTLINQQRYEETLTFEKYIKYYNNPDFYFLLGLIYMNNAKFTVAVEYFLKCTEFLNGKLEGITTYLPYYNIGVIFDVLGYLDQALVYYKKCGNYEPALKRLNAQMN